MNSLVDMKRGTMHCAPVHSANGRMIQALWEGEGEAEVGGGGQKSRQI